MYLLANFGIGRERRFSHAREVNGEQTKKIIQICDGKRQKTEAKDKQLLILTSFFLSFSLLFSQSMEIQPSSVPLSLSTRSWCSFSMHNAVHVYASR